MADSKNAPHILDSSQAISFACTRCEQTIIQTAGSLDSADHYNCDCGAFIALDEDKKLAIKSDHMQRVAKKLSDMRGD